MSTLCSALSLLSPPFSFFLLLLLLVLLSTVSLYLAPTPFSWSCCWIGMVLLPTHVHRIQLLLNQSNPPKSSPTPSATLSPWSITNHRDRGGGVGGETHSLSFLPLLIRWTIQSFCCCSSFCCFSCCSRRRRRRRGRRGWRWWWAHHIAYFRVHSRASSLYFSRSVLYIRAISGTSGSSGFGSQSREQIDNNTARGERHRGRWVHIVDMNERMSNIILVICIRAPLFHKSVSLCMHCLCIHLIFDIGSVLGEKHAFWTK